MQNTQALGEGAITALSLVQVGIQALAVTSQQAVERGREMYTTWQVLRATSCTCCGHRITSIFPTWKYRQEWPVRISLPMQSMGVDLVSEIERAH